MPLRIGLIVERRYLPQLQPTGMTAALRARGHQVDVVDPEAGFYDVGKDTWLEGLDLVVCRGRSVGLQCLLGWAEARGMRTVNSREAISAVFNKAQMGISLSAAHIPTPATFLGPVRELAEGVPASCYPLILKPIFGDNCEGLRIITSAEELSGTAWPEPVALAQHFVPNDGYDLKLYGIGRDVWAVRKLSCLVKNGVHPFVKQGDEKARLIPLTEAAEALALRCAELFGLELYGVDCVETADGPLVIEVNDFPNYTGVPGADEKLADFILRHTVQARRTP